MIEYGFKKQVNRPFQEALELTMAELARQGFGVLTTIDVKAKFKEKLNVDFDNYTILGACHPPSAYEAIGKEVDIGLLLPCNVIVYEKENSTYVSIIKPSVAMQVASNESLKDLAEDVEGRLKKVLDSL